MSMSINIQFNSDCTIEIYNNLGSLLQTIAKGKLETNYSIDLEEYPYGLYLFHFFSKSTLYQIKVIKKIK
jgi:hypothetical protein